MKEILDKLIHAKEFDNVTNQYSKKWQYSKIALNNLELYFKKMKELKPHCALVGIAPGYNGCRLTGIPFTSEYIVKDEINNTGLFGVNNGYLIRKNIRPQKEPTATIVWKFLKENQKYPLLWNAFPFHLYKPGNKDSNRNPNKGELEFGLEILKMVMEEFHIKKILAVGEIPYKALASCDLIKCNNICYLRHPANGGKEEFCRGLKTYFMCHRT
jgi:hypothetical protein